MSTWKTTATLKRKVWVTDGDRKVATFERVEVPLVFEIDWDGLAKDLGQKAFENRSGKSRGLNGLITVKAGKPKAG